MKIHDEFLVTVVDPAHTQEALDNKSIPTTSNPRRIVVFVPKDIEQYEEEVCSHVLAALGKVPVA